MITVRAHLLRYAHMKVMWFEGNEEVIHGMAYIYDYIQSMKDVQQTIM